MSEAETKWHFYMLVAEDTKKTEEKEPNKFACDIWPEVERLSKQRCPYCSGFGHSGKDCPTDAKLSSLRGGVREQNKVI